MERQIVISEGNIKLGRMPNVSLIPVKDCGNCEHCKKHCYALKAWRMYPQVKVAWSRNSVAFRADATGACSQVGAWCQKRKPRFFRWHVGGDVLNQEHADGILKCAKDCPDTKSLMFTKMHHLQFETQENLTVVLSMFPGMDCPQSDLPMAWYQDGSEKRIPQDGRECPGRCDGCGMCFSLRRKESVFFMAH